MTIGDELFALMQAGWLARPVNVLPTPVGKVNQLRLLDFGDACPLEIEAGIVIGHYGIVRGLITQLGGGTDSAGNYGVRIDDPLIASLDFRPGQTGKNGQAGNGRGVIKIEGAMHSIARPLDS